MSTTVSWRLPGDALDLPRIERLARTLAERVGMDFTWYELDPDADELEVTDEPAPPTGKGFVNVVFAFDPKRRLDVLWKVDPAQLPRDLAAVDATFLPATQDGEYVLELTFLRDTDASGAPHCRMWVDADDAANLEAWAVAVALGHVFARGLGGVPEAGGAGPSDQHGGRT